MPVEHKLTTAVMCWADAVHKATVAAPHFNRTVGMAAAPHSVELPEEYYSCAASLQRRIDAANKRMSDAIVGARTKTYAEVATVEPEAVHADVDAVQVDSDCEDSDCEDEAEQTHNLDVDHVPMSNGGVQLDDANRLLWASDVEIDAKGADGAYAYAEGGDYLDDIAESLASEPVGAVPVVADELDAVQVNGTLDLTLLNSAVQASLVEVSTVLCDADWANDSDLSTTVETEEEVGGQTIRDDAASSVVFRVDVPSALMLDHSFRMQGDPNFMSLEDVDMYE
jgi:hypothetical protein